VFELRRIGSRQGRAPWVASAVLHATVIVLVLAVAWRVRPRTTFITLTPPSAPVMLVLPPNGGSARGRGPSGGLGHPVPVQAAPRAQATPAPIGMVDSTLAVNASAVGRHIVTEPRLANPLIWVSPRPALPAEVADALYRPRESDEILPRDTVVQRRLRAMVDSMNRIIDVEQRERRLPSWTTEVAGKKFGMDSTGIYIAGVKIPTAVLMALGNMLPQGNFDESMRARQLSELRRDMVQAARRTQTLQEFRGYVRELRKRKQAEHDAARRQRGDTVPDTPDTVRVIP
jgi:hypothetical protein